MVDLQIFIDRLLETENLTDYLEDEDADYLIQWGVVQLKKGLLHVEDSSSAGEYTTALMGFIRTLNQLIGNLMDIQPDSLALLKERYQAVFGSAWEPTQEEYLDTISRLEKMTPRQAIDYLLNWLATDRNSSEEGGLTQAEE